MSRYSDKMSCIEITTIMGCKINCRFCPQEKLLYEYRKTENYQKKRMNLNDFIRILPQIYKHGTITFCGMSETFQNEDSSKMMREAFQRGFKLQLFTTLQGITKEDFENLEGVKFHRIVLHIPDEEGNSKFIIDAKYLEDLKNFQERYNILYYSCHGKVHHLIKDVIDPNTTVVSNMNNRAGHLTDKSLGQYSWKGKIVCSGVITNDDSTAIGWTPMLLPNGTLLACCNDYGLEMILGNLYTESWGGILNSPQFSRLEASFDDDSIDILCRKCNRVQCRKDAIKRNSNIIWNNAIKIGRIFQNIESKKINAIDFFGEEKGKIVNDLIFSKNICIFGLGKLFFDTFDAIPWKNVLLSDKEGICSDNDEKWKSNNADVFGLQFVEPNKLLSYEDLVVVTYVSNDIAIKHQLQNMGIYKIINIFEIFNICD